MNKFELTPIDRKLADLFGGHIYAIGGRVRDWLINQAFGTDLVCKDFDYVVTGHEFHTGLRKRLESIGARVDAVGASFAVLKVTLDGILIDVSLPRRESSTGTGHRDFEVDFGPDVSLEDDQQRRDFTMNAVSVRLSDGEIIATPGALEDIRSRTIRVLSPTSFTDDPLRMLRAVQFASRFGFTIEPKTERQIRQNIQLLTPSPGAVSQERINEELCKLLMKSPRPSVGIRLLLNLGMLPFVIPEMLESVGCEQNVYHSFDVFEHNCAALDTAAEEGGDLIDRLAALFHDVGKPRTAVPRADGQGNTFYGHEDVGAVMTHAILRRLRFSEEIVQTVTALVKNHMFSTRASGGSDLSDATVRRLMRRIGLDRIDRQFLLREADMRASGMAREARRFWVEKLHNRMTAIAQEQPALDVTALAISGRDVIDYLVATEAAPAGFRGDRRVGVALKALLERVLDDPTLNTPEHLLSILGEVV